MAEDIKDENLDIEPIEQDEALSSDGLIPEDLDESLDDEVKEALDDDIEDISGLDEIENIDDIDELINEEDSLDEKDEQTDSTSQSNETEDASDISNVEEDKEHPIQTKQTKLQKILMATAGVLAGVLIFGFILYLFGVFDPEPPKPTPAEQMAMDNNQTMEPEKYVFDAKDINIDRINGKLRILTKYEIIGTQEEERQKELEKNSELSTKQINELLEQERLAKQKALEEERLKKEQEELAKQKALEEEKLKKEQEELAKQKALEEERLKKEQEELAKQRSKENPYDLLKFIQVVVNEEALLSIKDNLAKLEVNISNCVDNSREFLLIGPFKSNKDLNTIFRSIYPNITQSASKKDLARLEYNRICK